MTSASSLPSTVNGWVEYTQTLHRRSIDMGLDRVRQVVDRLDLNHPGKLVVAIAGTNGKGSSVSLLESIAHAHGLSTGAYTSPHLVDFNERIRIGLKSIDDTQLLAAFKVVEQARGDITLTYFEFATVTAAWVFAQHDLDVVCLEVGLGGRLDAVRVFDADIALVTNVGLDHQNWLGVTREEIGYEKAGIMIPGQAAVCADRNPPSTLIETARSNDVNLWRIGKEFDVTMMGEGGDYWEVRAGVRQVIHQALPEPGIPGERQWDNLAGVLAAINRLGDRWPLKHEHLVEGVRHASLSGRLQYLPLSPPVLLDVAHNVDAVTVLARHIDQRKRLAKLPTGRCLAVFGMLEDKAVEDVIEQIKPDIDHWFTAHLHVDRGLSDVQLAQRLGDTVGACNVTPAGEPVAAYNRACAMAEEGDWILVFGSFHTVGDVIKTLDVDCADQAKA